MICRVIRTEGRETTVETFKSLLDAANYIDEMEEKIEGWWNELKPRNFQCCLSFEEGEGFSIQETLVNDAGVFTDPQETYQMWDIDKDDYVSGEKGDSFMGGLQTSLIKNLVWEDSVDRCDTFKIVQVFLDGKPLVSVCFGHNAYTSHRYKWNEINCEYEGVS